MNSRANNPSKELNTRPTALEDQEKRTLGSTSHSEPSTSNTGKPVVSLNAPFPRRLMKKNDEQQFKRFLELLSYRLPKKQKDVGSFTVPCSIGGLDVRHALCDLVASINLMPLPIFKKLGIGEAQPTSVTLQLADRTIKYPEEKIEDALVKVDNFIFRLISLS
ncbi:uncharacterized protein LOC120084112 [Benincasa hispida]|uniref:uncharacterized protein LOC120084112 n=1 Tax=Benincasa hispida TaxID=102211 RepID=UPI0018FF9FD4|nr:uncharacterized protein LOC120084112 [Benincasa hispida]